MDVEESHFSDPDPSRGYITYLLHDEAAQSCDDKDETMDPDYDYEADLRAQVRGWETEGHPLASGACKGEATSYLHWD